jgi:hypothetical protein
MSDEQRLQKFFTELQAKRDSFLKSYQYFAPQLAPQFTCFDFIFFNPDNNDENKLKKDELKLSRIIAHLLNPQGTHAQGDLFLKLFIKEIGVNYLDCNQEVTINCEVVTHSIQSSLRRIDILVDFGNGCFGLAIENKPWATDQNEQLSDYSEHLTNVYGDKYCLIYLSGDDSFPDTKSISEEKRNELEDNEQYQQVGYSTIVSWLKQCEKESKPDHVKHFLRDFIAYCQQEFLGETNMIDKDVIKNTILENDDNIGLALEIAAQLPAIKEKLLDKLKSDLENKFKDHPKLNFKASDDFSPSNNKRKIIYFRKQKWLYYALYISLKNGEKPNYGVIKYNDPENTPPFPNSHSFTEKLNRELEDTSFSYPDDNELVWRSDFNQYEKNWKTPLTLWLDIQSGEFVETIFEKITNLLIASERTISKAENLVRQEY